MLLQLIVSLAIATLCFSAYFIIRRIEGRK